MAEPVYYLAAAPREPAQIPTLTRDHGVRELVEHPPYVRYDGWNLVTLERAELRSGPRLHIQNGTRKFIDLRADSLLTVLGKFDGFLGWGRWDFRQRPKVNGLAVVEFTYEFAFFYERVLSDFVEPRPSSIMFVVGIHDAQYQAGAENKKLYLTPGPVTDHGFDEYDRKEAPGRSFTDRFEVTTNASGPSLDAGSVAYQLVRRVYNWFGFTDDAVPYTNDAHDAIDIALITNMRR